MRTLKIFNFIMWSIIAFFIFSCRTPQQLIDKAVKKDPTIVIGQTDTLRIKTTVIDSFPIIVHDSIVWEKFTRDTITDVIFETNTIYLERKKTRLEVRKEAKSERLRIRSEKRIRELELKNEKLQSKLDARATNRRNKADKKRSIWWVWYLLGAGTMVLIYLGWLRLKSRLYRGLN